jgi:hypothetical protein
LSLVSVLPLSLTFPEDRFHEPVNLALSQHTVRALEESLRRLGSHEEGYVLSEHGEGEDGAVGGVETGYHL